VPEKQAGCQCWLVVVMAPLPCCRAVPGSFTCPCLLPQVVQQRLPSSPFPALCCQFTPLPTPCCPAHLLQAARQRLVTPGGRLTEEEAKRIQEVLLAMPLNGGGTTGNLAKEREEREAKEAALSA